MMQKPSMVDAPFGGAPEQAPRWDLVDTEGYGGGIRFFGSVPDLLGVRRYIQEEGVRRWSNRGPTRVEGTPGGVGGRRAPLPHALLVDVLTQGPSPLDHVRSENHVPEGFIPFGLRLIFFFCETLKQAKKQQFWAGPPINRLVPKVI